MIQELLQSIMPPGSNRNKLKQNQQRYDQSLSQQTIIRFQSQYTFLYYLKNCVQMQSLNRVHNNLTNLHHDYNPSYVPIKREDYHWLIDSSSCQSTPSKSDRHEQIFSTPSHSIYSHSSFNSSCFSLSKYQSPLAESPTLPTTFCKQKNKRLIKQAHIIENQCPICLQIIKQQADLPCSHSYCLICLQQWLNNATKCPYCRCQVTFYTFKGQKIKVEPKQFQYQPRNDQVMDWLCYRCDRTQQGDTLLICDRCDAYACHIECDEALNGAIPSGEWYCHYCR